MNNQVFVIYGDVTPFPGIPGSADNRKILAVTDSPEKARVIISRFDKMEMYTHVDFEVMAMEYGND